MEMAETTITRDIGFEQIDAVAGGETAGIPFAAWIADRMMVPMQYVRKSRRVSAATRRSKAIWKKARACCWWKT